MRTTLQLLALQDALEKSAAPFATSPQYFNTSDMDVKRKALDQQFLRTPQPSWWERNISPLSQEDRSSQIKSMRKYHNNQQDFYDRWITNSNPVPTNATPREKAMLNSNLDGAQIIQQSRQYLINRNLGNKKSLELPYEMYRPSKQEMSEFQQATSPEYRRYMAAKNPAYAEMAAESTGGDLGALAKNLPKYTADQFYATGFYNPNLNTIWTGDDPNNWAHWLHEYGHYLGTDATAQLGVDPSLRGEYYGKNSKWMYDLERDDSIRGAMMGAKATGVPYSTLIKGVSTPVWTYSQPINARRIWDQTAVSPRERSLTDDSINKLIQKDRAGKYKRDDPTERFRFHDILNQASEDIERYTGKSQVV